MDKRTVIFRADASPTIGMGHFIRTLALAEMLNEHFYCVFATCQPSSYQIEEIEKVCHSKINLSDDDSHFNLFLNYLKGDEIVVLDNYFFDTDYQKAIKAKGCKLVCIDDLNDKVYFADLIINHTLDIKAEDYQAQTYTQFALGPKYALLRPSFMKMNKNVKQIQKVETLFICFGGLDTYNLTSSTLDVLKETYHLNRIIIVIGEIFEGKTQLIEKAKLFSKVDIHHAINDVKMAQLMTESDLAIIPSSGTMLEAMSVGLPVITGYYVPNQEIAAKKFSDAGLALYCGNFLTNFQNNLNNLLNSLTIDNLNGMLSRQKEIFGNSSENYLKLFNKIN